MIGLIIVFSVGLSMWVGYIIGRRQGLFEYRKALTDSLIYGEGYLQDGKWVNPKKVYK